MTNPAIASRDTDKHLVNTVAIECSGDEFITPYGPIGEPDTYIHRTMGPGRDCIHARTELPPVMLFGRDHILRYGWQPVVYTGRHWPAIISRTNDLATLSVDHIDGALGCRRPRQRLGDTLRWVYRLIPVRFADETEPIERVLLGVWAD